jgi:UrcA family protein
MNKSSTNNLFQAVLAVGALIVAVSTAAHAAEIPQVHVNYADLNVSSPAGAAVLYQRIRVAATQVCGAPDQRDLIRLVQAKTCTDKAIATAVTAVGNDMLTDLYQAKTHNVAAVKFASN